MTENIFIRRATLDDEEAIAHHRRAMMISMGVPDNARLAEADRNFRPWLRAKMAAELYLGWLAVDVVEGREIVVSGVGLWIIDWPPGHLHLTTGRGYVMNVYTEPEYRRRGLVGRLMTSAIDWCRAHDITVVSLHATAMGAPIYRGLGFVESNEMRLDLRDEV